MRLVILVCQLGIILRTEAQIPDTCITSNTNRAPENTDITVVCGTYYMDLSIYLCPVYNALYNESLMVLNNQFDLNECYGTADWNAVPPVLKFRFPLNESAVQSCSNKFTIINKVGAGEFSDYSKVQYINISGTVNSKDPSKGTITYRQQILYKFSCYYPMQYHLNNTEIGVSGVSLVIRDNNGSFISTLSMELYQDEQYLEILNVPQRGLNPKTRIYVAVKATNLTDRFNVLLDRCYATTSPYPTLSNYYDLFVGCKREAQTKMELNGDAPMAHFSFETFRFMEHRNHTVSTCYLHCVTRLCEVSSCKGFMPDCGSSIRLSKREAQSTSNSTIVTSTAIRVGKLSTAVTVRVKPTDISSSYQTKHEYRYKTETQDYSVISGKSSLSCYSSTVLAVIVYNVILTICFSV